MANATITGTGKHKVVAELNSGPGISEGTIFRPAELGTEEKYPIFAFAENGCIQNSLEAQRFLGEVASQGYFVIADGHPDGAYMPRTSTGDQGAPLIKPQVPAPASSEARQRLTDFAQRRRR